MLATTEPDPVLWLPETTVIHGSVDTAVHSHHWDVLISKLVSPPADAKYEIEEGSAV